VRAADELIDCIVNSAQLPSEKQRREIQRELRAHLEDFVCSAREAGCGPDEIEKLVRANFGDPAHIAQGFTWVYRHERRRLRAFAFALSTVLLASSLLLVILAMQTGLALSFGTPIVKVLASRHTVIEALDILASVAVYLGLISVENVFESHRFQKATILLTAIVTVLMLLCAAAGLHRSFLLFGLVNGVFSRAVQLFVTPVVARIGIVAVCFPLTGLFMALARWPISHGALAVTCASWLGMGVGYQLMTHLAARVDAAFLNGLRRIHAGS
jgi:hypothetical protein